MLTCEAVSGLEICAMPCPLNPAFRFLVPITVQSQGRKPDILPSRAGDVLLDRTRSARSLELNGAMYTRHMISIVAPKEFSQ